MILRLSERVSEGDAKFQGFCGRWNKWEGQGPVRCIRSAYVRLVRRIVPRENADAEHGLMLRGSIRW